MGRVRWLDADPVNFNLDPQLWIKIFLNQDILVRSGAFGWLCQDRFLSRWLNTDPVNFNPNPLLWIRIFFIPNCILRKLIDQARVADPDTLVGSRPGFI